jgi:ABC-type multidrug transport system fused ATPase/permease subunit
LWDLSLLAIPRILFALLTIAFGYLQRQPESSSSFELFHENGDKKSKDELEHEALEEPFASVLKRYVCRMPFLCEVTVFSTGVLLSVKCLTRLNVEIGVFGESQKEHPVFWIALALTAVCSLAESVYVDSMETLAGKLGRKRRREGGDLWVGRLSEHLSTPLLSQASSQDDIEGGEEYTRSSEAPKPARCISDIGADAEYSANFMDLLRICEPDKYMVLAAFLFMILSAIAQVFVPKLTGSVLDSLVDHIHDNNSTMSFVVSADHEGGSITHIPGFVRNIKLLVTASVLAGIFGGLRRTIFDVSSRVQLPFASTFVCTGDGSQNIQFNTQLVGARVNTRLRIRIMDSLLSQDIGFFDTTRTGDISSRLNSDTTLVGMSVTTFVNMFLQSAIMVLGYLLFMTTISWQLSILSFVTIPAISTLSKWYGRYLRRLSMLQQKKLAEGSAVCESAISSMPTCRGFGAEYVELSEFEQCMQKFLTLNVKAAVATLGYTTCLDALPELVTALVLFYGGLLVHSSGKGHISGGELISFVLYLSALSGAFNSLGGIYAILVRAVGAADKVFELLNREPRISKPSFVDTERLDNAIRSRNKHLLGVDATKVIEHQIKGLYPETCSGEIVFKDVQSRYPARPERIVLDGLNLTIPAGSIFALVGTSGSGKSSIVKLIQHLYEPQSGSVCIDGTPVSELSPDWLCRHVAIVQQEPVLFARSIKKNIMYGLEGTEFEPSQEEIEEAARLANAASFIEALPQGYDTEVGERGIQLSGGQKQR